jgi:tRNA G18 (ribose-2'-O)-methylase SpoU
MIEVKDLADERLKIYTGMNENGLKRIYEPKSGLFIAESLKVIERALRAGYEPESFLIEEQVAFGEAEWLVREYEAQVPVYIMPYEELKGLTGYALTGGVFAALKRKELPSPEEIIKGASCIAILDNIENPTNVGAIIRNAAALSLDGIILTSSSADPLYRRASRVSMGTVFQIPWTVCREVSFEALRKEGFVTLAMALNNDTLVINDERLKGLRRSAIILGNEGDGLTDETISRADYVVKIPMREGVDSLNVAAASAVAFWELRSHTTE